MNPWDYMEFLLPVKDVCKLVEEAWLQLEGDWRWLLPAGLSLFSIKKIH